MSNGTEIKPVTAEEVAALNAKLQELQAAQSEKDRVINDLNAQNATLQARVTGTQPAVVIPGVMTDDEINSQTKQILEEGQTDPATASVKLGALIKKIATSTAEIASKKTLEQVTPMVEGNNFAAAIRQENADLLAIEPDLELIVGNAARRIMDGKSKEKQTMAEFQKTVREVVAEKRKVYEPLLKKKPEEPAKKPDVPAGAQAETGGGRPAGAPSAGGVVDDTDKTTASGRAALQQSKGL